MAEVGGLSVSGDKGGDMDPAELDAQETREGRSGPGAEDSLADDLTCFNQAQEDAVGGGGVAGDDLESGFEAELREVDCDFDGGAGGRLDVAQVQFVGAVGIDAADVGGGFVGFALGGAAQVEQAVGAEAADVGVGNGDATFAWGKGGVHGIEGDDFGGHQFAEGKVVAEEGASHAEAVEIEF